MPVLPIIAPSVLASDMSCLKDEAQRMINEGCDWLHLDIMDGHFVPNISFGPAIVAALRQHFPEAYLDVHLMTSDPGRWVEPLAKARVNGATFHWEAVNNNEEQALALAEKIRSLDMRVGLAINPGTPVAEVEGVLKREAFDLLLVMTVEPGFGGQHFMGSMMQKVSRARHLFPALDIEVDGGLDIETVKEAAGSGANVIVAGTSIYKSESPRVLMEFMKDVIVARQG